MLQQALAYARSRKEENLERLCDWLRIPSVSTLPEHIPDVARAAEWAANYLNWLGMQAVEIFQTPGHPIVCAEYLGVDRPTLLVYGHFDVQPPDPLDQWHTPPFEPRVSGENLYARGANDDKGQVFAILAALEAYLKTSGHMPLNVKVLLEGEEEIGSPHLADFVRGRQQELAANAVLIADQEMLSPQAPLIIYGVRGNAYLEIEVRGPVQDLHSGTFGGAVDNPLNVLVRLLAALQDGTTRRVNIPGFYDRVLPLTEQERELLATVPINDEIGLNITGSPALAGEAGYSLAERISVRPTLDIHGIAGGFTGEGGKTVIPSKATAKLSMRLVPDQNPQEIASLCEGYLRKLAPPTVTVEVRQLAAIRPAVIDFNVEAVRAAALAYERGIGASAFYFRGGGSLPIVQDFIEILSQPNQPEIPIVMIGFGLPDDNTHAPNEKLSVTNFYKGIETAIHYLDIFGNIQAKVQ